MEKILGFSEGELQRQARSERALTKMRSWQNELSDLAENDFSEELSGSMPAKNINTVDPVNLEDESTDLARPSVRRARKKRVSNLEL